MKIKAAVFREFDQPLVIEEVDLREPEGNEVLVKIAAAGICHSDLTIQQYKKTPLPIILGHEASGTIAKIGPDVKHLTVGDKVTLSFHTCGECFYCNKNQVHLCEKLHNPQPQPKTPTATINGEFVHHHGSTFAEYTITSEKNCIKLPDTMPLLQAALLGCAIPTGYGAAVNSAKVRPGDIVAVFGAGGVGINAVQGAKISGAKKIIVIDLKDVNLEKASHFGATHTVNPSHTNTIEKIKELTDGHGVDIAIDATGVTKVSWDAFEATRRGGDVIIVGRYNEEAVSFNADFFHRKGKTIKACFMGDMNPQRDLPLLAELYLDQKLLIDELIVETLPLENINDAFEKLEDRSLPNVGHRIIVFD